MQPFLEEAQSEESNNLLMTNPATVTSSSKLTIKI